MDAAAVEVLDSLAAVIGVRLDDGRCVAVKRRPDESGRAAACVAVQRVAVDAGLPCADRSPR